MSREHEPPRDGEPPYWQEALRIGEARLQGEQTGLWLRWHQSEERYTERHDLLALSPTPGRRVYVHAQPYTLEPDIRLTVDLDPQALPIGPVGTVQAVTWEGMRERQIGQAQSWYYPTDRLLVLWECYLYDPLAQPNPERDDALRVLWQGFERQLAERFPQTERIATPSWDPMYHTERWWGFLTAQGYTPFNDRAFVKERLPAANTPKL